MHTLSRALKSWQGKGRKITIPFREIDNAVDFRTGDLAVLAAAPGGGKTLLAVNWAWKSTDPVLYLAQDSPRSVLRRFTALALGKNVSDIHEEDAEYWSEQLDKSKREELILAFGAHTVEQVRREIDALTEWLMEPPTLVIIDNLFDMRVEGAGYMENSFYATVLPELKQLAIEKDVGIIIMHHVIRSGDTGKKVGLGSSPLKMSELLFAGEREARHVWGVYRGFDNKELVFQVLKQQDGEADAGGNHQFYLDWYPERALLSTGMTRQQRQADDAASDMQAAIDILTGGAYG